MIFQPAYRCQNVANDMTMIVVIYLYFKLRGFVLNLYPQHKHHNPSHFKRSHILDMTGFGAL